MVFEVHDHLKRIFCSYVIRSDFSYIYVLRIHVYHIFMCIFKSLSYVHSFIGPLIVSGKILLRICPAKRKTNSMLQYRRNRIELTHSRHS